MGNEFTASEWSLFEPWFDCGAQLAPFRMGLVLAQSERHRRRGPTRPLRSLG